MVFPFSAAAQGELTVTVNTSASCDQVDFSIEIKGGNAPYSVLLDFGDEESYQAADITESTIQTSHVYPSHGEWEWKITLQDDDGLSGEAEGLIALDGPSVTLSSNPFPPLLTIESGEASAEFTAEASDAGLLPIPTHGTWTATGYPTQAWKVILEAKLTQREANMRPRLL